MSFKPNLSVKEGLDHLATRLDPIIGERLAPDLGGHPWTVVLDILDEKKGHASQKNWTHDLQAQLRMLTERLGSLGYPFDDKYRTVSTLGSELRIVRNQMAHMHAFSTAEAFRANDFSVRLLEHFDDVEGLSEADRLRHLALKELAREEGVAEGVAAASATPTAAEEPDLSTSDLDSDSEPEAISRILRSWSKRPAPSARRGRSTSHGRWFRSERPTSLTTSPGRALRRRSER